MVALSEQRDVGATLAGLATALEALEFGPDAPDWSAERDRLTATIRSYLIPRAVDPATRMTVVLAGPTGSGKSTLMNSLAGREVSRTGALRPTTKTPVALAPFGALDHYRSIGGVSCEVIAGDAPILESMVLVDTPDLDSTSTGHRAIAETLIDNADIVVFVTSALRYADEVPWQVLRRTVSRGTPVIQVLNRVGSPSAGAIVDFKSRLAAAGMDDDLVIVPEHHLADGAQKVPALAVRSLHSRLAQVVSNREEFAGQVFSRVLRSTISRTTRLAREMAELVEDTDQLAAELSVYLVDRLAQTHLDDIGVRLHPSSPAANDSRRVIRRWKKTASRIDRETRDARERDLVDRMVSVLETDLRGWLADERPTLRQWNIDPAELIEQVLATARSSIEGWIAFVMRIAEDHDERDGWPGGAVLADAAITGGVSSAAVEILFGGEGPVLVDRARRELWGRMESIYVRAGDLMVTAIRRRHGDLEDEELRASLGSVSSLLAPAHA